MVLFNTSTGSIHTELTRFTVKKGDKAKKIFLTIYKNYLLFTIKMIITISCKIYKRVFRTRRIETVNFLMFLKVSLCSYYVESI